MKRWGVLCVLSLFFGIKLIGQVIIPNFPMVKQDRSLWCWAACAEMVDSFFFGAKKHSQCEFAFFYLDTLHKKATNLKCPPDTLGSCHEVLSNVNGNVYFSFPASYFGIRFEKVLSHIGLYSSFETKPQYKEIKYEIDNRRPLIAFVSTTNNSNNVNHFVIVKGYRETETDTFLILNDPWFHSGNSSCTTTASLEFNYSSTTQTGSIKSIAAFLMNIHPKNMVLSALPTFRRTSFENQIGYSKDKQQFENDTIRIGVKVLSIEKIKSLLPISYEKKFFKNEIYELYSPSVRRSYVFEKTSKGDKLTEIKQANYPTDLFFKHKKDSFRIDDIKDVILWQYPLPPFHYFYEFKYKNRTVVAPLSDLYQKKGIKLEDDMFYSPRRVMHNLRQHNRHFFGRKLFLFFFTKMAEKNPKAIKSLTKSK